MPTGRENVMKVQDNCAFMWSDEHQQQLAIHPSDMNMDGILHSF